jgi:succinate dehydrogenase / fumarate reductase cytochrome b subunit
MALSILHRATGVFLSIGLLLLVGWLTAIAYGSDAYSDALTFFRHPLIKLLLVAFSYSFFYHLLNGVRHLTWDTGRGLERKSARASGWVAFLGSIVATAFFWFLIVQRFAGGVA